VRFDSSDTSPRIAKCIADLRDTTIIELIVEGAVPESIITFDNGYVLRQMAMLGGWIRRAAFGFRIGLSRTSARAAESRVVCCYFIRARVVANGKRQS
jgi:hypothetical protein